MSKVIICQGIQGSGKSTWALDWVKENPIKRIRVNRDSIRKMFGKYCIPEREEFVKYIRNICIEEAIIDGYDVVCDDMNLSDNTINELVELVKYIKPNISIEYKLFNTPLKDCLIRVDNRNKNLPEDERISSSVVISTYNTFKNKYNLIAE